MTNENQKDVLSLVSKIQDEMEYRLPGDHKDYLSLKDLLLEEDSLEIDLGRKRDQIKKMAERIVEEGSSLYEFNSINLSDHQNITLTLRIPYRHYSESILSLIQSQNTPLQTIKQINYTNLNDLNSAKFLTDDEKRDILGLTPLSESTKKDES